MEYITYDNKSEMIIEKSTIINLIKHHCNNDKDLFKKEAYKLIEQFNKLGDEQLSEYIMCLLGDTSSWTPQN